MQVTKKSEYALISLLYLSGEDRLCDIGEIASARRLPVSLVAKTLQDLARAGILASKRGRGGGFSLAKAPGAITVLEVIEAVEGPIALCECLARPGDGACENRGCGLEAVWARVQADIRARLGDVSIKDILDVKGDDVRDITAQLIRIDGSETPAAAGAVVFCDFDGTISKQDVSDTIFTIWLKERWADIDREWHDGAISMVELYEKCWALVNAGEVELYEFIDNVEIDPYFAEFADACAESKVPLYLVSDGFDLYIDRIMGRFGLGALTHYSNHLEFVDGRPEPSFTNSHPDCIQCANCKKFVLDDRRGDAGYAVYIGNGLSDRCAAEHADLIFAKDSLLAHCREKGIDCVPYDDFSEIIAYLQEKDILLRHEH